MRILAFIPVLALLGIFLYIRFGLRRTLLFLTILTGLWSVALGLYYGLNGEQGREAGGQERLVPSAQVRVSQLSMARINSRRVRLEASVQNAGTDWSVRALRFRARFEDCTVQGCRTVSDQTYPVRVGIEPGKTVRLSELLEVNNRSWEVEGELRQQLSLDAVFGLPVAP
jgi:hypothetical protein